MQDLASFVSNKKFYAEEHFPYGLARSGEFTSNQAALLENNGVAYQELHSGNRVPANDEERNFVLVCQGQREAQTSHEIAWMRYCQKTQITVIPFSFIGKPSEELVGLPALPDEDL